MGGGGWVGGGGGFNTCDWFLEYRRRQLESWESDWLRRSWGRILGRNWEKSLQSFPSCYSQSTLLADFTPPSPWRKSCLKLVCNRLCIRKPQVWELSRLCQETSTKLYVHEFGFWILPCYLRLECEFTTTAVFLKRILQIWTFPSCPRSGKKIRAGSVF